MVVLDEFPALAGSHPGLTGLLQRWWDTRGARSRLFVILSGSALGFIEREVLSHRSPLFGRRTASVKLEPLAPWEIAPFVPGADAATRLTTYGLFGGVPAYLERVLPQLPTLLGPAFERDCRTYVAHRWHEDHAAYALRVGRQWHKERDGSLTEIDLVADLSDGTRLVAECKATRRPVGPEVLQTLQQRAAYLPTNPDGPTTLAVFTLAGLTEAAQTLADREGIEAIDGRAVYAG